MFSGYQRMSGICRTVCVWRRGKYYDDMPGEVAYGFMYHGITYADEAELPEERDRMTVNFWRPIMKKGGIIEFLRPERCPEKRFIKEMKRKVFGQGKFTGLQEFKGEEVTE